ncbi:fumarylacetoacetate hydrolase family protein [Leifsonia sp. fls2-241-R2A-40a]|uniref:fumarylacetoacetate hydrolase family protein n=1 Tax=Leifsonia sp. fls2-241-R2A-40a TaxID=3040290 RepID=UPI00254D4A84|nr:fumarylacetoacetate hydrolase family protein [Leifsonia sp. fls2-241-R2A-40a]
MSVDILPVDQERATLVGRAWIPDVGPSVVAVREGELRDVTADFPTVSSLIETGCAADALESARGTVIGTVEDIAANTGPEPAHPSQPSLLAPVDLQVLKAAGVTFAVSMIERVIEERARGDVAEAAAIRRELSSRIGEDLAGLTPGSEAAGVLKKYLIEQGWWSQYLEVGIGPDAEIFTKAATLSAVGFGSDIGVLRSSEWNNPEPEVAVIVDSRGHAAGATLANDVNLRDVEGRSALLLPRAKDNNASCALGPFVRLFDDEFAIDDVRRARVRLDVTGEDGFELEGWSDMSLISRDPLDLVGQLMGAHHQYPDGAVLMLGTLFAPTADRKGPGLGFSHEPGDIVRISSPALGTLTNRVEHSEDCPPWTFGLAALFQNLAARELTAPAAPIPATEGRS